MKTLSPAVQTRRFNPFQRLAWLLDLTGPGLSLHVATRPLLLDGIAYVAHLLATPQWRMAPSNSAAHPGSFGRVSTHATVRIAEDSPSASSLSDTLRRTGIDAMEATLRLVWLDDDGQADPADPIVMLSGSIAEMALAPAAVELELVDPLTLRESARTLREYDAIPHLASDSPMQGRTLPFVFGVFDRLRLHAWDLGRETRLAASLAIDDDQAFIDSLEGFPPSGIAQIGDERIQFDALDLANSTLGTPEQPIVRLEPAEAHNAGVTVRAEPPGGFTWFVADHVCASVSDPHAGDQPLPAGSWTAETLTVDGHAVQLLRLDRVPSASVTARVEGWRLPGGAVADHPVDILEVLLTNERLGGLDSATLDPGSFAETRTALTDLGATFARVVDSNATRLGDLIDDALREMNAWLRPGGALITLERPGSLPWADPVTSLNDQAAVVPDPPSSAISGTLRPPATLLFEPVHAADPPLASYVHNVAPPPVGKLSGGTEVETLSWLDGRSLAALADLADRREPAVAHPALDVRLPFLPGHLALESGDPVDLTCAVLDLTVHPFRVERIETDGPAAVQLSLRGPLAGPVCFAANTEPSAPGLLASASFVRPFGAGRRILIAVSGSVVARLSWGGDFAVTGELTESGPLAFAPPWDPAEGPFALRDLDLVFASGDPGAFDPFFTLDASGEAFTEATIVESAPLPAPSAGECVASDADGWSLAPHPSFTAMHYDAATNELRIAGELVEGGPIHGG